MERRLSLDFVGALQSRGRCVRTRLEMQSIWVRTHMKPQWGLMERFVLASPAERASSRLAPCPPHIRKAWHLGMARRKAAAEQQHSVSRVANLLATTTYKFVFEEGASWQEVPWESMTEEDQAVAKRAWDKAEFP